MWLDTHAHFDAPEFDATRSEDWGRARAAGVLAQVIPAVAPFNFDTVRELAHAHEGSAYALGIHPMYVNALDAETALAQLRVVLEANINDSRLVAVGEIGLDGFVKELDWDKQLYFYQMQLKLAREFDLPVLLHVRHAQDTVIKYLRQYQITRGIAHAFNGSFSQAEAYIKQGMKLGFGGMMTFDKANQIRRLAAQLPIESIVLETDAPDIPPAWGAGLRNDPANLPRFAEVLAGLRGMSVDEVIEATGANALAAVPGLKQLAGVSAALPPESR